VKPDQPIVKQEGPDVLLSVHGWRGEAQGDPVRREHELVPRGAGLDMNRQQDIGSVLPDNR
jgi:hypothetical protein